MRPRAPARLPLPFCRGRTSAGRWITSCPRRRRLPERPPPDDDDELDREKEPPLDERHGWGRVPPPQALAMARSKHTSGIGRAVLVLSDAEEPLPRLPAPLRPGRQIPDPVACNIADRSVWRLEQARRHWRTRAGRRGATAEVSSGCCIGVFTRLSGTPIMPPLRNSRSCCRSAAAGSLKTEQPIGVGT